MYDPIKNQYLRSMEQNGKADTDAHPRIYMYKRIVEAKLFMDRHYAEKIDLNRISDQASFSKYHFLRLFKEAFGKSPHRYLTDVRLSHAKRLLKSDHSVSETAFEVGFESIPSFVTLFRKTVGTTPNEYARREKQQRELERKAPLKFIPNCYAENFGWKE